MKKLIFFLVIYFSILNNFDALSLKTNNSNYFVNINNSIYRFKKIINIENNEALFNLKYDNYNNLNDYELINDNEIEDELLNNINNAIYYGYESHNKSDIFYYLTQTLIYKFYYGFSNAFMCSSDGMKITIYDDLINQIKEKFILDSINDYEIDVYEDIVLPEEYTYNLEEYQNKIPGIYNVAYYSTDKKSVYYRNMDNYLFSENNRGISKGEFKINVKGIKFNFKGLDTTYLLYENDKLIKEFNNDSPIKYLKMNTTYLLKYDDKEISIKTTNADYELTIEEELQQMEEKNIDIPLNPKTNDDIITFIWLYIGSVSLLLILYINYRKSLKNK